MAHYRPRCKNGTKVFLKRKGFYFFQGSPMQVWKQQWETIMSIHQTRWGSPGKKKVTIVVQNRRRKQQKEWFVMLRKRFKKKKLIQINNSSSSSSSSNETTTSAACLKRWNKMSHVTHLVALMSFVFFPSQSKTFQNKSDVHPLQLAMTFLHCAHRLQLACLFVC